MAGKIQKAEKMIEDFMAYLSLSDLRPGKGMLKEKLPLSYFGNADPMGYADFAELTIDELYDLSWWRVDEKAESLGEPLNYTFLSSPVSDEMDETQFGLVSFKQLTPQQARGRVRLFMPNIVEVGIAYVNRDGTYSCGKQILGAANGSIEWQSISHSKTPAHLMGQVAAHNKAADERFSRRISIAMGQQFLSNYVWRVEIEGHNGAGLSFYTDHSGARSIFRLRDVPDGKERRTMIRNWVTEHWRKRHDSPEDRIWIEKHLRGHQTFHWKGLTVRIFVPRVEHAAWLAKHNYK